MSVKQNCFFYFSKAVLVIGMLCCLPSYSQVKTDVTDQLAENLQKQTQNVVSDLVYIQTSKNMYETEEDVWFKGYVLDGQYFSPSIRSKVLFVQLIEDKTQNVVWEKKYEIENGFVNGHLFLENSLSEGNYTLAGYSSYSFFKEPKEFYALKKITIVKTISQRKIVISLEKDSIVHFSTFPEGGKLVSGIQSTLGFKALNSKGSPIDVSGTLFEDNIPLQKFKSSHAGLLEQIIWMANPLSLFALVHFIKNNDKKAVISSFSACCLAISFSFWNEILGAESGAMATIISLELGYYLWVSSILVLTIGIFIYYRGSLKKNWES